MPKMIARITTVLFISLIIVLPVFSLACGYQDTSVSPDTMIQENDLLQFTAAGHVLGFGSNAVYLAAADHALKMEFAGGSRVQPVAESAGETETGTAALGSVCYQNVWDNIDITYSAVNGGIAESTYVVYPGGNPADISLQYNVPVDINTEGSLCFNFETGNMTESAPFAWQEINGEQLLVDVSFQRQADDRIGFNLSDYNADYTVFIDPTYQWHTFYGTIMDYGRAIVVDSSGNIYVTGNSRDSWNGPNDTPPLHAHSGGLIFGDIVVIKLNNSGSYQWHTFYGGSNDDVGHGIALDQSLNIYITGESNASWLGPDSEQPQYAYSGGSDIVILKLDNAGTYQWHTFFGSADTDRAFSIVTDTSANIYVCGHSEASWIYSVDVAPLNPFNDYFDVVIIKVNTDGGYLWHTFFGCQVTDAGTAIALDQTNNVYVTGNSYGPWNGPSDTPPLHNYSANADIIVIKLNSAGAYQWHTFYGAFDYDHGYGIVVDSSANVYVCANSEETWNGPGGELPLHAFTGEEDIVALSLTGNGTYRWHTFYGSAYDSTPLSIALDPSNNNLYLAGYSAASWNGPGNIPPVNAHTDGTNLDIVLVRLNGNGDYVRHTFYGCNSDDQAYGVKVDAAANVYMTGYSSRTWNGPNNTEPLNAFTILNNITVIKTGLEPVPVEEEPAASGLPVPKPFLDDSGAVVMGSAPNIGIGNVNMLQSQVAANKQAVIYANVVNKGDLVGSFTVTLKINGQVEETRAMEVSANSAVPIQFNVSRDEPGTYMVDINGKQTSFTVVGTNSNATDLTRMAFIIGIGVCSLAAVVTLIALILRRRTVR